MARMSKPQLGVGLIQAGVSGTEYTRCTTNKQTMNDKGARPKQKQAVHFKAKIKSTRTSNNGEGDESKNEQEKYFRFSILCDKTRNYTDKQRMVETMNEMAKKNKWSKVEYALDEDPAYIKDETITYTLAPNISLDNDTSNYEDIQVTTTSDTMETYATKEETVMPNVEEICDIETFNFEGRKLGNFECSVLSVRLYEVLDWAGASEEIRKLRQHCCISTEIAWAIGNLKVLNYTYTSKFFFGSSSEGTTTRGLNSDTDILTCFDTPVYENFYKAGDRVGPSLLMHRSKTTKPGYVKLERVFTYSKKSIDHEEQAYDCEGRTCIKHMSLLGEYEDIDERNGPADTYTFANADYVYGFRCFEIPDFANEWITRQRQFNWPSKQLLNKMTKMGCFLVGVGYPDSKERYIEWRLSFSLQERELMFSMNTIQHKCYIVLKMIKKDLIEPVVGKSISSYHLKTCMFHIIENTSVNFWAKTHLVKCVLCCMTLLLKWVGEGYCPNYFIKEENMFDRDIHRLQKVPLSNRLKHLLKYNDFFNDIKLDNVGSHLRYEEIFDIEQPLKNAKLLIKCSTVIHRVFIFRLDVCRVVNKHNNPIHYLETLATYMSERICVDDHTEKQTNDALSYLEPYVRFQLSQSYASHAFRVPSAEEFFRYLELSNYDDHLWRYSCFALSSLLQATIFFKLEQYEQCFNVLYKIELCVLTQTPLPICQCGTRYTNFNEILVEKLYDKPISEYLQSTFPCVIFLRSDMPIIPKAIQYEFYRSVFTAPITSNVEKTEYEWFDLAVVDPVVYLHFMQYLVSSKLHDDYAKYEAIDKLENALTQHLYLGHEDTGYNLLGWIYFEENCIQKSFNCFKKSWIIRPHHNAAKMHMLYMLTNMQ